MFYKQTFVTTTQFKLNLKAKKFFEKRVKYILDESAKVSVIIGKIMRLSYKNYRKSFANFIGLTSY